MDDSLESVLLVDEQDNPVGAGPKLDTHREGALHRAFSIFLFDSAGRTLLQKRASGKYHSAGKWANACCGHPRPGEAVDAAARRRLGEELGVEVDLSFGFLSRYSAQLDNGMTENEIVHVFYGECSSLAHPNPSEVSDLKFVDLDSLQAGDTISRSDRAVWLQHYLDQHFDTLAALRDTNLGGF